jgi:hypothetical protein
MHENKSAKGNHLYEVQNIDASETSAGPNVKRLKDG